MADLTEVNQWTPGVYQIETSDPVVGGPDGVTNLPIKQLTNRTLWLKEKFESLKTIADRVIQATELSAGMARIATQDAVKAGTETNTMVTPNSLASLYPFRGRAVFSTPGTFDWIVPSGVTHAWVVVIAGGGGGARSITLPGPSGGSGGGVTRKLVSVRRMSSMRVVVGAGGKGAADLNTKGARGGVSAFGNHLYATGGEGGLLDGTAAHGGQGYGCDEHDCIGLAGHPIGNARNDGFLGGAGGGGESGASWNDARKPQTPGHGGGGRGASAAPDGADGRVTVQW
ncbi:glycine-rich domain-containing protein [Pseudomonas sp. PB106]|uniref:glycine-rich domain-containing protein n=1 Tax=Pseudomonas sp. PB106 TaxID=2494699 RepID=UPI00131D27E8|nr:hypothetical protein [Pseudomonas sp. PB106]KAE9641951.1 hypothetical protein EJA71_20070 [Pseudomonas sp. PB106]